MLATIGKDEVTGKPISFDITKLAESRLLITATSGGGKSYAIRKVVEEASGKIQIILIDSEGEFASLRKDYDFILVGKGADVPADVRSAELLARKLLEFETSAIIDLYELPKHERIKYVKSFLSAMVDAPKELWHPCLVILDEAHTMCPEKQEAESSAAVIDMASRGRKRGFAIVLATQRLSKLDKDAAAECINKLIGVQSLDIDRKRASDELGYYSREQILSLRDLEPGQFYCVGPAISKTVTKIMVDPVKTQHPKAGQRITKTVPVPTDKVKTILQKFTDLPKEAEQELKDKQSMMMEIAKLRRELTLAKNAQPVKQEHITAAYNKGYAVAKAEDEKNLRDALLKNSAKDMKRILVAAKPLYNEGIKKLTSFYDAIEKVIEKPEQVQNTSLSRIALSPPEEKIIVAPLPVSNDVQPPDGEFGKCERSILKFLAMRPGSHFNKAQIGAMTLYAHKSGGFSNALSKLASNNLIVKNKDDITINPDKVQDAIGILGSEYVEPSQNSLEQWLRDLPKCDSMIYQQLYTQPMATFSKEELGQLTGYASSSGGFSNAISHLVTLGLAVRTNDGIRFNPDLNALA